MNNGEKRRLYTEYVDAWEEQIGKNEILSDDLGVTEVKRGIILPLRRRADIVNTLDGCFEGGVCTRDFKFAGGFLRDRTKAGKLATNLSCTRSYKPDGKIHFRDETVIFGGVIFKHFGHSLVEGLSRLWYFVENPDTPYKIVFIRMLAHKEVPVTPAQIFELFGLTEDKFEIIDAPTQFAKVIVPDEGMYARECAASRRWLKTFGVMKQTVADRLPTSARKKVYLTRTALSDIDGINEEYFEDFYRARGFDIVSPERFSLEEQINIIMNAEEIACTMGTIAHLVVFARDGIKLTILLRIASDVIPVQLVLNELRHLDWNIIDGTTNLLPASQSRGMNLYAPNRFFREFLADHDDAIDRTDSADNKQIKEKLYQYLHMWGEHYSGIPFYKRISRRYISEILSSANIFLREEHVDPKDFKLPFKRGDIEKINDERIAALKAAIDAVEERNSSRQVKLIEAKRKGDELELRCAFFTPFYHVNSVQFHINFYNCGNHRLLCKVTGTSTYIQKGDNLHEGGIGIDLRELFKALSNEKSSSAIEVMMTLSLWNNEDEKTFVADASVQEQLMKALSGKRMLKMCDYKVFTDRSGALLFKRVEMPPLHKRVIRKIRKML